MPVADVDPDRNVRYARGAQGAGAVANVDENYVSGADVWLALAILDVLGAEASLAAVGHVGRQGIRLDVHVTGRRHANAYVLG
jgi:hypothetical protein